MLLSSLAIGGCHAQLPAVGGGQLSPELARRIALMIRTKAALPFNYEVKVADRRPAREPGWDEVTVFIGEDGKPLRPMTFLLSKDSKTLAQMNTFDISKDPKTLVSDAGRPARGGSEKAPVEVVVFDDLECPFCARMHAQMFPAILNRYGDKVRVSYKDFPLTSIHPWATHAAVNADCLAAQNGGAYWSYVDTLHNQLDTVGVAPGAKPDADGKTEKTLPVAVAQIDKLALDEGAKSKLDMGKLSACVNRQDDAAVKASAAEGDSLGLNAVPAVFVNGEQITGAVPIEYVYRAVDAALTAQGITPPPAVPIPPLDSATPSR